MGSTASILREVGREEPSEESRSYLKYSCSPFLVWDRRRALTAIFEHPWPPASNPAKKSYANARPQVHTTFPDLVFYASLAERDGIRVKVRDASITVNLTHREWQPIEENTRSSPLSHYQSKQTAPLHFGGRSKVADTERGSM